MTQMNPEDPTLRERSQAQEDTSRTLSLRGGTREAESGAVVAEEEGGGHGEMGAQSVSYAGGIITYSVLHS